MKTGNPGQSPHETTSTTIRADERPWRHSRVRAALVIVDAFAAVTSLAGGIALVTGLEGDRFPPEMLRGTPFPDYTLPGLILAGVVGGSTAVATVTTLRHPRAGGLASMVAGAVMMGWISGELRLLKQPLSARTWWEVFYFAVGAAMFGLGLRTRRG